MNDEEGKKYLIDTINDIILCRENQDNVNKVYDKLIKGLISEMDRKIPKRNTNRLNTKHVKVRHAFWNKDLESKWQVVHTAERMLRRCKNRLIII